MRRLVFVICVITSIASRAEGISFSQILAAPADVPLNIQYARQQIEQQDLLGALSALERVMLVQPGNVEARLLAIRIRLWLGNQADAQADLDFFTGLALPPQLEVAVNNLNQELASSSQTTRVTGAVSLAVAHDNNPGQYPAAGVTELSGRDPLPQYSDSEGNTDQRSANITSTQASIRVESDLNSPVWESYGVSGNLSKSSGRGTQLADNLIKSLSVDATAKTNTGRWTPRASIIWVDPHYGDKQRLISLGASVRPADLSVPLTVSLSFTQTDVDTLPSVRSKDHRQAALRIVSEHSVNNSNLLLGQVSFNHKRAKSPNQAAASELLDAQSGNLAVDWIRVIGSGIRTRLGVNVGHTEFRQRYSLEPRRRIDKSQRYTGQVTYAFPSRSGVKPEINLEVTSTKNHSNLKTYSYRATQVRAGLSLRF